MNQPNNSKPPATAAQALPLVEVATNMWEHLEWLVYDHLQVLALELREAGESLAAMLAYALALGLLLVSVWLSVMVALALWLIDLGIAPSLAALLTALLNLVAAAGLAFAIRRRSRALSFPATIRNLQPQATAKSNA